MKHFTVESVARLMEKGLAPAFHVPKPFPGKRFPTRVAWYLESRKRGIKPLSYIGKSNIYRVREAMKYIRGNIRMAWFAEFDRGGLLLFHRNIFGDAESAYNQTWLAYHPNGVTDFFNTHGRPFLVKRVGGQILYSTQKRLSQEMIDQYYAWYHKTFKVRLKRPRGAAFTGEAG